MFVAAPALAQSGLTGNWSGTYSVSIQLAACSNKTFSWNGNASVTLLQAGSAVTGRVDLTNFTFFSSTCTTSSSELTKEIAGTTDGSTLTAAVPNDPNGWQLTGPVGGGTITLQLTDANGLTGTFTLTRATGNIPTTDFTGSWSGNYSFNDICPNGSKIGYTGTMTLGLTQSGENVAGVMTMSNVPLYDQNCATIANLSAVMSVAGTVSGSTFTGVAFDPTGSFDFPFTATIGSAGLTGTATGFSATTTTGTFNLTQSSPQAPASDFSGHFDGTYMETDNGLAQCFNVGNVNFADNASVSIVQAGNAISGVLVLENTLTIVSDGFGDCQVLDGGEEVLPFYGTLSNGAVSLTVPLDSAGDVQAFTFNLSGDTVSGSMTDSFGDVMSFTTTRTAPPPAPTPSVRRRAVKP